MRIINIISGSSNGGAEKFFERFCIALSKKKKINQIVIYRKNSVREELFKKYSMKTVQLSFFNNWDFFTKRRIKKTLDAFQPNIIFTWMNRASLMLPKNVSRQIFIGRLGGYYKLKNYINCDYLVANTKGIKEYILKQGWDPKKVIHLPNFVNENTNHKIYKNFNIYKNTTIILGVGRFHENKGFDILIKSLISNKDCILWLVGEGSLRKYYIELAKKVGVFKRLKIFSWTNNISKFYNSADILVCSSRIEPLGNIILEGWAHKIPVISSNIMGPNELITHNLNGLKFEKEKVSDLSKCINFLKKNSELKKKLSKNGFQEYKNNFSERIVMNKFLTFFKEIIN